MSSNRLKGYLAGYLPINFIEALTALSIVVIYTRLLTPEQYGRYALAVTIVQWLQTLVFYWLCSGVARFHEASRVQGQLPVLLSTVYMGALSLNGLLAIGIVWVTASLDDGWRWLVIAGLASLIARSLLLINLERYRAAREVRLYTRLEGAQYIISLGLGVLLVSVTNGNPAAILWGSALACSLVLLLDASQLLRLLRPTAWSGEEARRLARYGLPLAVSVLLGQILAKSDRFFIAWLMDDKAVGVYAVVYALVDRPSTIIFNWVGMATVPLAFAAMEREGPAAARQVMTNTGKTLVLLLLPCTVGLAVVAEPLATVVFGVSFREEATWLIPWIALASLLYGAMVHYASHAFMIAQNTRCLLFINLAMVAVNMVCNFLLIPPFGLEGAVAASILTYAIGLGARLILARQFFPIPLVASHCFRGLLACGVMAALVRAAALPATLTGLLLSVLLGAIAYVAAALLFNVADSRDWVMAHWRWPATKEAP
jgi:O-antigen/teichoic acid export membrane protein